MRFLGNVLATIVGLFLFSMLFFFGLMLFAALASSSEDSVTIKNNSVIELDLSQVTADYGGKFKFKDINYFEENHDGFADVLKSINAAASDDRIQGISILNDENQLGMAQLKALREALETFKKSGKFVYAYANVYTQKGYYLATAADQVYLNPVGELDFKGLSTELMFFKDLQEKSGIKMEVIRHGKYKSAVEPFLENQMSEPNRRQITELLQSVWSNLVTDIAKSRNLSVAQLNAVANGLLARTPAMAVKQKLVDQVAYEDVYHDAIRRKLDVAKTEAYNKVKILDYANEQSKKSSNFKGKDEIAIVYAQGEIGSGEGGIETVGEGSMRRALEAARNNDNVKAVVLRVDSPGGSALTSDLIWREVELTKKQKPVVVSMGNLAASGGYYISCGANRIFAEPNTITGSIGVFGVLPNFTTLSERIGIHTQEVKTHENAAGYSPFRPLDENFRKVTQEGVEHIYRTFVARVAAGRKMPFAAVDSIAQGRVWSGSDAKKIGLVDEIGGLDAAIAYAAKAAKTKDFRTQDYPEYERNLRDLLAGMGLPFVKSTETLLREQLGNENYKLLEQVRLMSRRSGVQAALPYTLDIR